MRNKRLAFLTLITAMADAAKVQTIRTEYLKPVNIKMHQLISNTLTYKTKLRIFNDLLID